MYLSNTVVTKHLRRWSVVSVSLRWWIAPDRRWLSTNRDSIGTCTRDGEWKRRRGTSGEKAREGRESTNASAGRHETFLVALSSAETSPSSDCEATSTGGCTVRAYNEANRATALARGCSPRFGSIRRRSPFSASHPRLLFGGLRGTSTACAYEPQQGCNHVRGSALTILRAAVATRIRALRIQHRTGFYLCERFSTATRECLRRGFARVLQASGCIPSSTEQVSLGGEHSVGNFV